MNLNTYKQKILITCAVFAAMSSIPAFAVSASDLNTSSGSAITNGSINFDTATKTTTVATTINPSTTTDVKWVNFNIDKGETVLHNFQGNNQTIIHRVTGDNLSTIAGTMISNGIGAATGKVLLINPNGVLFNGATINLNALLVSTLGNAVLKPDEIAFYKSATKIGNIQIYNTNISTEKGASFITNGDIDVRNSQISATNGHIQLVTADGVNFVFKSSDNSKSETYTDWNDINRCKTEVIANNSTSASNISISKSKLTADNNSIEISTNSSYAANSTIVIHDNSTLRANNGSIYISAMNDSYSHDPKFIPYLENPTNPKPDFYSNVELYSNITGANSVHVAGTNKTIVKNITANNVVTLSGENIKTGKIQAGGDVYVFGNYDIKGSKTGTNGVSYLTLNQSLPVRGAEGSITSGGRILFWGNETTVNHTPTPDKPDVPLIGETPIEQPIVDTTTISNNSDTSQYSPKLSPPVPTLSANTNVSLAGAAAKVKKKPNPSRFVGHIENGNINYYEILE